MGNSTRNSDHNSEVSTPFRNTHEDQNFTPVWRVEDLTNIHPDTGLMVNLYEGIVFPERSTVLLDMDGVLADFEAGIEKAWAEHPVVVENNWFPLNLPHARTIKLPPQLRERWGEEAVTTFRSILSSGSFYHNLTPIDGALDGVQRLIESGHDVKICTRPSRHVPTCADEKKAWAYQYLGKKVGDNTIVIRDKTLVPGDYLIDDKPSITGTQQPTWVHVVFSAPYNTSNITWRNL